MFWKKFSKTKNNELKNSENNKIVFLFSFAILKI